MTGIRLESMQSRSLSASDDASNAWNGQPVEMASSQQLGMRTLTEHVGGAPNMHARWYTVRKHDGWLLGPLRIARNYFVVELMKYMGSLSLKRWILRHCLGMKLGRNVTISPGVTLDYFFPELTELGDNTIVGLNAVIITHEFFHDRFRTGPVKIGPNTMIGAQSMVLAGCAIGSNVRVSAMSFVNRSVPDNACVAGNPIRVVGMRPPA